MSPEGVFILGGRSCPRRAERSRNLGKMLVASGGIALQSRKFPLRRKLRGFALMYCADSFCGEGVLAREGGMVACFTESAGGFWRKHPPATNSPSKVLEKRDIGRDFRVSGGFLRKVGRGIHCRIRDNLPENNRYS